MKVVCISDTHCMHRKIKEIPEADVLIHAGDIVNTTEIHAYRDFADWLNEQPVQHKVIIPGNHDILFETHEDDARGFLSAATNTHILLKQSCMIDGYEFWGAPHTPYFCDWAFNEERGDLHEIWDEIPEDVDVVVTHGPMHKYGDTVPTISGFTHEGCWELKDALESIQPKLHVCGHIHEGYGIHYTPFGVSINASTCTGQYKPTNSPIVFEI